MLSPFLGRLYQYEVVRWLKNRVQPIKHVLFGKNGIYRAIDDVSRLSGGADRVGVVFDIGAATGEYTEHFLKAFPNATVYCFEPLTSSFAKLKRRTAPYAHRVRLYNYGLYDHEGELRFYVSSYPDGSSLVEKIGFAKKITIPVRCLDDVVREEGVSHIDFMKIDVKGTKKEVLAGGRRTVVEKVVSAFIEIQPQFRGFYSPDHLAIFEQFADAGFGWGEVLS